MSHDEKSVAERKARDVEEAGRTFVPATDIYETPEGWELVADMPGVDERHCSLEVRDGTLIVHAQVLEEKVTDYELTYSEYRTGDFKRTFRLSGDLDQQRIQATVKNGVLKVFFPKSEAARPRRISVKAG